MHALGNVIALAQCQTSPDRRAGAGRPLRIQRVDIKGQMYGGIVPDVSQGHLHDAANAIPAAELAHRTWSFSTLRH